MTLITVIGIIRGLTDWLCYGEAQVKQMSI